MTLNTNNYTGYTKFREILRAIDTCQEATLKASRLPDEYAASQGRVELRRPDTYGKPTDDDMRRVREALDTLQIAARKRGETDRDEIMRAQGKVLFDLTLELAPLKDSTLDYLLALARDWQSR